MIIKNIGDRKGKKAVRQESVVEPSMGACRPMQVEFDRSDRLSNGPGRA